MTYQMSLFIILINDILLSLLIILIYYFILIGLNFQYTKPYLFIIKNNFFYIALLNIMPAVIQLLKKIPSVIILYWDLLFLLFLLPYNY